MEAVLIYKDPAFLYEDFCVINTECFPRDRLSASQFDDLMRREFWTACFEGRTVGFMSAEVAGNSAHLSRIAVLSAYRGKGIASRMMDLLLLSVKRPAANASPSMSKPQTARRFAYMRNMVLR
jgi:ribosomal protein S18 acetylase RimI-like enzyme